MRTLVAGALLVASCAPRPKTNSSARPVPHMAQVHDCEKKSGPDVPGHETRLRKSVAEFLRAWQSPEEEAFRTVLPLTFHVIYLGDDRIPEEPENGPAMRLQYIGDSVALDSFIESVPSTMGGYADVHGKAAMACDGECCQLSGPEEDVSNNAFVSRICFGEEPTLEHEPNPGVLRKPKVSTESVWGPIRLEIQHTHP